MMPPEAIETDLVKCEDIHSYAKRACKYMGTLSLEGFLADDLIQAAVIRCIEVVGEAARIISDRTRSRNPQIPWAMIISMRNILAHGYGTVNLDKVYEVVTAHLPELIAKIQPVIKSLEVEIGWQEDN